MSRPKTTRRSRRLNTRAAAILAAVLVVGAAVFLGVKALEERGGKSALLTEARRRLAETPPQPALALGYLNRYLEVNPDDLDALELKGNILADGARDVSQADAAAKVLRDLLGRAPDDPKRQETRRRLVKLLLRIGQAQAAQTQAEELIKRGADDAEAHRLLAQALEFLSFFQQKPELLDQARREYEAAEAREPGDVVGAEELARLYRDRLEDPVKALQVLDQVVATTEPTPKKHAAALLARARHFAAVRKPAEAEADITRAVRDDPSDPMVRMAAAEAALQRRDTAAARGHLAAIDPAHRDDLRQKVIEGMIDLIEQRPDDAIAVWRAGLVQTGGTNPDLTWRLAQVLLETGRVDEAAPLIDQYRRLVGGEQPDARYRYLRGLALLKTNRPADALAELEAIRYKGDERLEPVLYYALGQAYEATRRPEKALEAYRRSAETSDEWSAPWTAAARLQTTLHPDDAPETLRKGLVQNPDDPKLLTTLAQVLWRREMQKPPARRSWTEVERYLDRTAKVAPGSPELALIKSDYLTATGRPDEAVSLLESATRLNPRVPEVWLARANALALRARYAEALRVLDDAIKAAGPQAGFFTTKATWQIFKGQMGDAKKTLTEGEASVALGQKPLMWKALGDFYKVQNDLASARAAYAEWARLVPENPEPRLALFEIELAGGDDAKIAKAVDEVRRVGGDRSYFWRLARIEDLMRPRPKETPDPGRDARRLDEAEALAKEIQAKDPQLSLGFLLEGRIAERRKKNAQAIDAYDKAVERGAGQSALLPLIGLLLSENRRADLDKLREKVAGLPGEFDRLATAQAFRLGDKERADELSRRALQGDPQALDSQVWRAEVLKALGKPDEAEAKLKELVKLKPDAPGPRLSLLMLYVSRGDTQAAARIVEDIRAHVTAEFPEMLQAQCYRVIGNNARAEECYRRALQQRPGDLDVLKAMAAFYEATRNPDQAEAALRAIRKRDPSAAWATRKLALSLASHAGKRDAWEEALSLVGPEPRPDDVTDDRVTRALVYARSPDPAQRRRAVVILEGVVAELPVLARVHEEIARLQASLGEKDKALAHAAKAAAGDRATPDAILFYAGLLLDAKDLAGADAQLGRLAAIDPDSLPVAEVKARLLAARGKGAEGAKALEKAFDDRARSPDGPTIAEKMVPLLVELGQPEAAGRVARKAAETGAPGRCVLAEFLDGQGKPDEAEAELKKVAGENPNAAAVTAMKIAGRHSGDPAARARWVELAGKPRPAATLAGPALEQQLNKDAYLFHLKGEYEKEIETYKTWLKSNPTSFMFLNNAAWTLSEEMRRPEDGLKWADDALRKVGSQTPILDTRGVILTRLKRFPEAERDLKEAEARTPRPDATLYYHLYRLYKAWGKPDEARKYRERAEKAGLKRDQLQPSELADWETVADSGR